MKTKRFIYIFNAGLFVGPFKTEELAYLALSEHGFERVALNLWSRKDSLAALEVKPSGLPVNIRIIAPAEWDIGDQLG